jgi:hypothetical protein
MKHVTLILILVAFGARAEVLAAQCSSYFISEINLVSVVDTEPGNVHTFVGFGQSRGESEKNAASACSHVRFDLETCVESDRTSGRNVSSDSTDNSLHLKYEKAVRRITGCS